MESSTLVRFLKEHNIDADDICHLVDQGIEMERIKLEIMRSTNGDSIGCYVRIMEGERLVSLLSVLPLRLD